MKTFQEFWKTFNEAEKFDPDQDALVLATPRSNSSLNDLEILSERARASFDAEDFKRKLGARGIPAFNGKELPASDPRHCGRNGFF